VGYRDRTGDLCRVIAKPVPPIINGHHRLFIIGGNLTTGRRRSSPVICGPRWSRCRRGRIVEPDANGILATDPGEDVA